MCIGTGTAIAIAVGAGTAGAGIYSAHKQAGSAHEAVTAQTAASDKAAEIQAQSAADALAYTKAQEAQARIDADTTQRGNYDQWRAAQVYQNANAGARARNINALGARYGVAARDIPEMAIPEYRSTIAGDAAGPGAPATPTPTIAGGDIAAQVADYYKARGVTPNPTSVAYWAQKWNEFGARDPAYFNRRLAAADEFGGAPGLATSTVGAAMRGPAAPAALPVTASVGSTPPINPALTVDPYQRRTVRDYFAA
jgi:hypothetical protein